MNRIGIIGGTGAFATSFLLKKINDYSVLCKKSKSDEDFLNIVTISNPYIGVNERGYFSQSTFYSLLKNLHELETLNCNIIVIACNTLHFYYDLLNFNKINSNTFIVNLPQLLSNSVNSSKVLIFASQKTTQIKIFDQYLINKEFIYPTLNEQQNINQVINILIQNKQKPYCKKILEEIVSLYVKEYNINGVILGCTELSLLNFKFSNVKIYDSIKILAKYLNQIN